MKKIITINEGGFDNLGDHAIYTGLRNVIKDCGYDCDSYNITRINKIIENLQIETHLSNNKYKKNRSIVRQMLSKYKLFKNLRWVQCETSRIYRITKNKYDVAFIGGGQLILSNSMFPISMLIWVIFFKIFNTKIYLIGVGSGVNFSFFDKLCYKIIFSQCEKIILRDQESRLILHKEFDVLTYYIPDLAFYLRSKDKINESIVDNKLIVGIIDYKIYLRYSLEMKITKVLSLDEYIEAWYFRTTKYFDRIDEVVLISTAIEDIDISKKLYEYILSKNIIKNIIFIERLLSLDDYILLLTPNSTVLSARMHALILAQTFRSNVDPWIISRKLDVYAKELLIGSVDDYKIKIQHIFDNILK
jgi:polysaccharide pyruvyl transferase WcaK-like protein